MKKRKSLVLLLITVAGASIFALTRSAPTLTDNDRSSPPALTEDPLVIAITPSEDLSSPCAYTWAYHDLPDITVEFASAIQALVPEAEARASAFGEDCINADGRALSFSAMETDFYVIISVLDLNDNEALGIMIEDILPILDNFPLDRVSGPKEGFIEITFRAGEDQRVFRIPLSRGRELREQGLHGAELIGAIQP